MTKKKHKRLMVSFIFISLFNVKGQVKIITRQSGGSSPENSGDTWSAYVKGFIQTDAMLDFQEMGFKDGFIAPSIAIPQNNSVNSNFSIKQSQIGFGIKQMDENGNSDLSAYTEIDFLGPNGTTAPRFRQGYIKWKKLLIGQTWSNFSDFDIFPNIFDFVGPNGTMFIRTVQIRYSTPLSKKESLSLSLEDPNAASIFLPNNAPNWKKKSILPIFTAVYRYGNTRDYCKLGTMVSPISYEIKNDEQKHTDANTILGYSGMVSARLYSGTLSNFRFQSSYGKGYSSYNVVLNGEKYDAIPDMANNRLVALNLFNIVGIYEHWWNPKLSSVIYYSFSQLGRKDFVPDTMIHNFQNSGINLAFQPRKKLRMSIEGTYGMLKNFGRQKANIFRIQLSSSLSF
ncbi:DcaP family trimeric outer membrane transporter [Chryseobacterium sp. B21-037]|uniref:DcaP family trimeric outer membrane transporter n=1 Tax=Chryseobacterium sp. B21-037 TaxID=2926038 RepID=UPI00235874A6|nr:DcaP family trimeric outer membrane transporter [Chryseobacterium sp. B21-037]MDC8104371.1 DcaP family trimeric outer membrane transporter [Chryseobacterium sp. B21-037]